jgi:hypothetical protein
MASVYSAGQAADALLADAEFGALRLGAWLNTPSGESVAAAVMALTAAPFKQDIDLLIEGLQLAAQRPGHFLSFWPADGIWAKTMRSVGRGAQPPRLLLGRSP